MVWTWLKTSQTYWISITPRKAAKTYQTAKWCLRSSGSLGGFFAFGCEVVSPLSPKRRNRGKRQPGAGSMSLVGVSSMLASHAERSRVAIEDAVRTPETEQLRWRASRLLFVAGLKGHWRLTPRENNDLTPPQPLQREASRWMAPFRRTSRPGRRPRRGRGRASLSCSYSHKMSRRWRSLDPLTRPPGLRS